VSVNLHELANSGSYGMAKNALAKAGLWDEYAGQTPQTFRVKVSYEIRQDLTESVQVTARTEEEAVRLATKQVEDANVHEITVTDTEVL
jgi:hypothetical protein